MSTAPIKIRRKNNFNLLKEGRKLESFDDFPLLRPEVDPQFHLSRNSVDQPFYLCAEKDMVLAQFSGASRVVFTSGPVRYFDLSIGDFVYVPAGSGHRIYTREPGFMVRYKAAKPGAETIFWQCEGCGETLFQHQFDATAQPAQLGYQEGCEKFNDGERTCGSCHTVHPPVDLSQFRWRQVADSILSQLDDAESDEMRDH
ncbi:hypothetical protein [Pusillimonas sp.]|uniref:hypothetical protein n=1 Tax=Pusillimonas sp. TaxID=3040095 RepID=UPI0029ABC621|nr:hypothetical protein [Pusillimonas sp.]MDX3895447.1 hypothetical protein [Pusillimonas sp.]